MRTACAEAVSRRLGGRHTLGLVRVREVLQRRLTWPEIVASVGISVAFICLSLSGYLVPACAVLLLGLLALVVYVRIQRRRLPARTERLQETALLSWPCETVWDLIKPAEKAPLLDPSIRRGYRVPGTPDGLGEQQALERLDGSTVIIEVIEYEHGRLAVTRQVSPPLAEQLRTVQTVEPAEGGCVYTIAVEVDLRTGLRIPARYERTWREYARQQIDHTQRALPRRSIDSPT